MTASTPSPGYGARCKACNSPRRAEIDRRLLAGESTRTVSTWLAGQGETIHQTGLANHQREHLAVLDAAKAKLAEASRAQAAPAFESAVEKVVAGVELLDEIADLSMSVARTYRDQPPTDMPGAVLFTGALREARSAVKTKYELLHGKKVNVDATDLASFLALGFDADDESEGRAETEGEGGARPLEG